VVNTEDTKKSPGQLLVEARTIAGLSIADVSDRLNLSVNVVEQLESDQYREDIPDAFVRGYLRTYARLVGLNDGDLILQYSELTGKDKVENNYIPSIDVPPVKIQIGSHLLWFKLVSVAVVAVILGLGWFAFSQQTPKTISSSKIQQIIPAKIDTQKNEVAEIEESLTDIKQSNIEQSNIEDIAITEDTALQAKPMSAVDERVATLDTVDLDFTFIDDCWVQIIDSQSNVLAVGLKSAGRRFTISGVPPISVVLGKPRAVALQYDNQAVDLSIYPAGRSAKFTLGQ